jgi:hypothetical protein
MRGFSGDILADFRRSKGLRIRAGTGSHRFIGIWFVVLNDRVFVRSWNKRVRDAIDRVYLDKYNTPGAIKYARDLGSAKSRATTLELRPFVQ